MNPREAALLSAAATLLSTKQDVAYGPAHAVRDALALEQEIAQQALPSAPLTMEFRGPQAEIAVAALRNVGAL